MVKNGLKLKIKPSFGRKCNLNNLIKIYSFDFSRSSSLSNCRIAKAFASQFWVLGSILLNSTVQRKCRRWRIYFTVSNRLFRPGLDCYLGRNTGTENAATFTTPSCFKYSHFSLNAGIELLAERERAFYLLAICHGC